MTVAELRRLFKKQIPAAYQSLQEAATMPESEAKRYKVQKALEHINKGYEILAKCEGHLRGVDELMLYQRVENISIEKTALVLYGKADKKSIHNAIALEGHVFKRLYKCLTAQEATQQAETEKVRQSMAERLKAREERLGG